MNALSRVCCLALVSKEGKEKKGKKIKKADPKIETENGVCYGDAETATTELSTAGQKTLDCLVLPLSFHLCVARVSALRRSRYTPILHLGTHQIVVCELLGSAACGVALT